MSKRKTEYRIEVTGDVNIYAIDNQTIIAPVALADDCEIYWSHTGRLLNRCTSLKNLIAAYEREAF